jgi:uncharacterized protein YerC
MKKIIRTSQDVEKLIWQKLLEEFSATKSPKEAEQLLNILMTAQERETIARRLGVISLIKKGFSYKRISEKLWVSPVTISTIKKSILGNSGYKSYHWIKKDNSKKSKFNNDSKGAAESALAAWFNHIAFMLENAPRKSGPRWKFRNYGRISRK